jgi:hypothetical protein
MQVVAAVALMLTAEVLVIYRQVEQVVAEMVRQLLQEPNNVV